MDDSVIKKLKSTVLMQNILRNMCSRPEKHELYDGWGTLEPWSFLNNAGKLYNLILSCTRDAEDNEWQGRNL